MNILEKIIHLSKKNLAYETLRTAIVEGKLQPGERLNISDLALQLGISEIPVREAINRLNSESFIYSQDNSHNVAPLSEQEFLEMLEIRLSLEIIAIRIAMQKIDEEGIERQKKLLLDMQTTLDNDDIDSYAKLHKLFHRDTFQYCGIAYLNRALDDAWDHHERGLNVFHLTPWEKKPSLSDHKKIVEYMEKKDIVKLEKLFITHRRRSFDMYFEKLRIRKSMANLYKPRELFNSP